MSADAMDIDSNPPPAAVTELEKERKRKHKTKEGPSSPSKKKRKHEPSLIADEASTREKKSKKTKSKSKSKKSETTTSTSIPDSPYALTTATLYLPLSPISISPTHALASLLAEHLSPLILTYYPPLNGVVLAYSNASISSTPPASSAASDPQDPNPQPLTLAQTAGEYGVLYVYLTATFLVFRPQRGQILEGWVNVQSEGFLGAVVLNLFSVGIERKRLPSNWKWAPPGEEEESDGGKQKQSEDSDNDSSDPSATFDAEKEHFKPITLASDAYPLSDTIDADPATTTAAEEDDSAAAEGCFQSVSGHRVRGTVRFRVVDIDVIPGSERDRSFMSIEGTMLTPEEEARVCEDERNGVMTSFATPGGADYSNNQVELVTSMSGALAAPTTVDVEPESPPSSPVKTKESKTTKEKKTKTKSKKKDKEKEKEK